MKEATGELNMTIVTLVAISAIAALLWFVIWPMIQRMLVQNTCQTYGKTWHAVANGTSAGDTGSDADVADWKCCKGNTAAEAKTSTECFETSLTDGGGSPTPDPAPAG